MNRVLRPIRIGFRLVWLASELAMGLLNFTWLVARHGGMPDRTARARWLQRVCRRLMSVFRIAPGFAGPVPSRGLLVSNHLGYLDIIVLGAAAPCVFVSKSEVRRWPVFGWFATLAGTLFIQRERRSDVARMISEMQEALHQGVLLVLFPEGTSSDGSSVLPFKSSLLGPVAGTPHPLAAAGISYSLATGSVADEICYWRDMTLVPHLFNLLSKERIDARVCFKQLHEAGGDRKQLAEKLRSEVVRLKTAFSI